MTKKMTWVLSSIVILGTLLVFVLFLRAGSSLKYSQDFVRIFPKQPVIKISELNLQNDSFYFAGIDSNRVYFGIDGKLDKIYLSPLDLTHMESHSVGLNITGDTKFEDPLFQVTAPFFYLKDGKSAKIYRGYNSDWVLDKLILEGTFFSQAVPISKTRVFIRSIVSDTESKVYKNVLGIICPDSLKVTFKEQALKSQIDSFYSTTGSLRFIPGLNRLVFTYAYRNAISVLDTNLNIVGSWHTIDSITKVKIKPIKISKDRITLASPLSVVNKNTQVDDVLLFVQSNLMGNEDRLLFDRSSVIDVYNLKTLRYQGSFYVPDQGKEKMKTFLVFGTYIFALYNKKVIRYEYEFGEPWEK